MIWMLLAGFLIGFAAGMSVACWVFWWLGKKAEQESFRQFWGPPGGWDRK